MSASPSGGPNGQTPTPPQTKGLLPRRKPRNDPFSALRPRSKPQPRPAAVHAPGTPMPITLKGAPAKPATAKPQLKTAQQPDFEALRQQNGGWSSPRPENATEWDLVLTKQGLKDGLRAHVMRMVPPHQRGQQQGVDPSNQTDFPRPVLLHRRDPRQPPPGREVKEPTPEETNEQAADRERLEQLKAEKDAQRALDDAQKAPTGGKDKKPQPKQKEKLPGTKVNHGPRTEEQKKESGIRYEEALPWHLEDADGKNVWVGQYEAPLSDTKVAVVFEGNNRCSMIPLQKWYKFTSKRSAMVTMSIEEAERTMGKKVPVARWAARDAQRNAQEQLMVASRSIMNGGGFVKQESRTYKQASRREKEDQDDIDMSGDEFQDDDETAGFEPEKDEDSKEAQEKIKREQLGANLFGDADEKEVDQEETERLREDLERKLFGKDMKKSLKRRDKQFQYDESDDSERERDPFADSSDDSESESDEGEKKDEDKDSKDKVGASGANSKGSNTPQGKKNLAEAAKKGKSLKRPGSPMVSDSSGNESTRKNKKKKLDATGTSRTDSRSGTPVPGNHNRRVGAGSGSDGEATAGEMSDGAGGKIRKKKTAYLSAQGTGTGARGTPVGSRAGSPAPASTAASGVGPITAQEIIDALPEDPARGTSISTLLVKFQNRVGDGPGQIEKKLWIRMVKENSVWNQQNKTLSRKKQL